ncbi:DUF2742 domain-containing protein [Mycolicibacterium fortuitum]|uniref:PhiRv1 phage protein n=1 Tax=Mycolicibacterium fortuitum subsp. fortuitum DSM 46621 = ATCC 6841 = JCM 6387 TaxID=1214102 RepID=K0VJB9_MYCFO|nr:DUF2742 domain-containing protein [Mycolicibacterium fortuitum]CRL72379.1 phiRv1 phage protein [Mycolicibacter nonchromogenicus]EJZ14988.1 hypothetical protein MFORT_06797 [Mycolicibacterium fortuitum subsp. fortuitum DSM 46621 = ATCC 6841 = JCM 6387]WEV32298.1 DUF2742 domain-containing protein [Mycolicibacterium fortuitum]CRL56569.1 phiRv1 phage protein [Mycolicibacterium fortuitum subsp. fortuitum DSM 46621 = ATCC 6841 = JCM 6387]BDE01470.1 hypothetical protein MFTT_55630 [Mycolicibacteri
MTASDWNVESRPLTGAGSPESQQVAWWPVHEFITAMVNKANAGPLPVAGTPAWCELSDSDPRKLLALARFGEHWALRTEIAQEKRAEASREIAAAGGWTALAQRLVQGAGPYIPRKAS